MGRKQRRLTQAKSRGQHVPGRDPLVRDFREAVQYLREGKLQEAEQAHRRVLAHTPRHAPSLLHLGVIAFKNKARSEAVDYIRQSLEIDPECREAWLNLAVVLGEQRRLDEAIAACRQCLALGAADPNTHAVLGSLLQASQNTTDALAAYTDSLKLKPDQPTVLVKTGKLLLQSGKSAEALALCRRALDLSPGLAEAQDLERRILATTGDVEAAEAMVASKSADPAEQARLYDELGIFLSSQRRFEEAVAVHRRAIALARDRADSHLNLAAALEGAGRKREALTAYQAALAIEPERADGYMKVGVLLRGMDLYEGAITAFQHAVKLDPKLTDAHYNLGITYKVMHRLDEAVAAVRRASECAPEAPAIRFELCNLRRMLCDWDGLDAEEVRCLGTLETMISYVAPFLLLTMPAGRAEQLKVARRYAEVVAVPDEQKFRSYLAGAEPGRRIRIGYLSADFCSHATAMLLAEVLEKSDREKFEIVGYCFSPDDGSDMRRRIIAAFDRFVDIRAMGDQEAARTIHADGIDILVDLKGYTRHARTGILAYKPAPIQVNYLAYPGTMGADFIDYILADPIVAPMAHQEHYAERIVHLPHCYQPNDRQRKIAEGPVTRAQHGLPEDAFVFCSFNNNYKLNAAMFDVWMRLLARVPGSVLWVLIKDARCRENLMREAAARGVDPARLVFADPLPNPEHLARHRLADLFLDTLPCNAHTTASDALWAGLPVLTCLGETFSGRVAASLLAAMGLDELIAESLEAYEQAALAFAEDRGRLDPIRRKIAAGRETSPLFDSTRYALNLERAYETMVDIMRRGEAPRPFAVVEDAPEAAAAIGAGPLEARIPYESCPVCDGHDIPYQIEAKVSAHPLYNPELPPTVKWRACESCGHFFTEGHFTPQARGLLLSAAAPDQEIGHEAAARRKVSARIVERVARHVPQGEWLDFGTGNGSLLFTAAEWGYQTLGADRRIENVERLLKLGFKAYWSDIEEIEAVETAERFSVVSLAGVLPRAAYPRRVLAAVHRMMRPGGALFVSMPNMDTIEWRILDASGANPYWGEIEHCHNFTRERLFGMLDAQGFRVVDYGVGEIEPSAMEVIAVKL